MNARGQRTSNNRNSIARFRLLASLLVFLGLLAACSWWKPDPPAPLSPDSFAALKQRVASIRGLPFKRELSRDGKISAAADNSPRKDSDDVYNTQPIARLSQVYKRLALLPNSADLGQALTDFRRLQRIASYDSRKEVIVIAPESFRLGQALAGNDAPAAEAIPAVFALTQALQEQNFQWSSKLKIITEVDRKLAFDAVARGDIVLTGLAHLRGDRPANWQEQRQAISRLVNEIDGMASGLPPLLREKLVFPYREGSQFVQWAYTTRGMEGINALFANPPLSTAQIMHPEKFYLRRQNPLRILAWGLVQQMKEAAVIEQTLGEYLTQLLLTSSHSRAEAARIASRWGGDQLYAYADGENLITCWISAWDNETSAQEFARAFETVLARRHGLRFESPAGQKNSLKADLGGGRTMIIEARGSLVLFLDGLASLRALESTERIWQEMEIGTESTIFPFDSAQSRHQLASRRR